MDHFGNGVVALPDEGIGCVHRILGMRPCKIDDIRITVSYDEYSISILPALADTDLRDMSQFVTSDITRSYLCNFACMKEQIGTLFLS